MFETGGQYYDYCERQRMNNLHEQFSYINCWIDTIESSSVLIFCWIYHWFNHLISSVISHYILTSISFPRVLVNIHSFSVYQWLCGTCRRFVRRVRYVGVPQRHPSAWLFISYLGIRIWPCFRCLSSGVIVDFRKCERAITVSAIVKIRDYSPIVEHFVVEVL